MKTFGGAVPLVKKKSRRVRKALGRVVRHSRSSEGAPLTKNEEVPTEGSSTELVPSDERDHDIEKQWTDIDLSETTERLKKVTIKDEVKPGTSNDPDIIELIDVQDIETEKKKKKKKRKFSKKKMRKKTWKAMKSGWKYMKAGLVMLANSSASWSLTSAVNTVIQDYSNNKDYGSSGYRSRSPIYTGR